MSTFISCHRENHFGLSKPPLLTEGGCLFAELDLAATAVELFVEAPGFATLEAGPAGEVRVLVTSNCAVGRGGGVTAGCGHVITLRHVKIACQHKTSNCGCRTPFTHTTKTKDLDTIYPRSTVFAGQRDNPKKVGPESRRLD
jgi:hypothetical protein